MPTLGVCFPFLHKLGIFLDPHTPISSPTPSWIGFCGGGGLWFSGARKGGFGFSRDHAFEYIGVHAKKLEMLSLAFARDSDLGLHYVLSGSESLRKMEIKDCPFGDEALLANAAKLETTRSLWMSNCSVTFEECKLLAQKLPGLNVEVIDEKGRPDTRPQSCPVEKLHIYRTVSGRMFNTPGFVWRIAEDASSTPYSNGNCSLASS
ncbi:Transport inhibitor response 1-like protein [Capsicum baccatum]|uniref:Transport inhibitor response 1-like protein n=1 Tax=Capsicum baccatum TaxID=33114 RepID=A0A2G2WGM0_CAPBA|nr:Transport inhibitor response 1-like protein [Capsicum baccatum]